MGILPYCNTSRDASYNIFVPCMLFSSWRSGKNPVLRRRVNSDIGWQTGNPPPTKIIPASVLMRRGPSPNHVEYMSNVFRTHFCTMRNSYAKVLESPTSLLLESPTFFPSPTSITIADSGWPSGLGRASPMREVVSSKPPVRPIRIGWWSDAHCNPNQGMGGRGVHPHREAMGRGML